MKGGAYPSRLSKWFAASVSPRALSLAPRIAPWGLLCWDKECQKTIGADDGCRSRELQGSLARVEIGTICELSVGNQSAAVRLRRPARAFTEYYHRHGFQITS